MRRAESRALASPSAHRRRREHRSARGFPAVAAGDARTASRRKPALGLLKSQQPSSVHPPKTAFIVVDGRRWRTSDPHIPDKFRQELVNELMAARRAVRDAKNQLEIRSARRRVNDAKLALGERGHAWWLPSTSIATTRRIEAAVRALVRSRKPGRSICPSDIARIVSGTTWRPLLPLVRRRAVKMAERGELQILRRGRVVKTQPTEGVLRYRLTRART